MILNPAFGVLDYTCKHFKEERITLIIPARFFFFFGIVAESVTDFHAIYFKKFKLHIFTRGLGENFQSDSTVNLFITVSLLD